MAEVLFDLFLEVLLASDQWTPTNLDSDCLLSEIFRCFHLGKAIELTERLLQRGLKPTRQCLLYILFSKATSGDIIAMIRLVISYHPKVKSDFEKYLYILQMQPAQFHRAWTIHMLPNFADHFTERADGYVMYGFGHHFIVEFVDAFMLEPDRDLERIMRLCEFITN